MQSIANILFGGYAGLADSNYRMWQKWHKIKLFDVLNTL
ncbi:hypothetical protein MNBD_ALPHA05-337 [hydrothermal vent metagenome]|uniref:Uncharacterized protein n=1 Tax=hydrothermal vent metagenome TaxID=652676 RepID=A0A3B0SEV0_9ZZZZ